MTIQEMDFIFDNEPSEFYDVMLCNFDTQSPSNDEEVELLTDKSYARDEWELLGVNPSNPLKFSMTIAKKGDDKYFTSYDQRAIKKWLMLYTRYAWLQVVQDDLSEIHYKCLITFSEMVDVGGRNAGMKFNVTCNSTMAWSPEELRRYVVSDSIGTFYL
jgi:hypothetical protein